MYYNSNHPETQRKGDRKGRGSFCPAERLPAHDGYVAEDGRHLSPYTKVLLDMLEGRGHVVLPDPLLF
jgi:hypothetical protein